MHIVFSHATCLSVCTEQHRSNRLIVMTMINFGVICSCKVQRICISVHLVRSQDSVDTHTPPTVISPPFQAESVYWKILLLTNKALNALFPSYLQDVIVLCIAKRTLRSQITGLLVPSKVIWDQYSTYLSIYLTIYHSSLKCKNLCK